MDVIVPAPKMGGWLQVNWSQVKRRVEKCQRRSAAARAKADRIERGLARSFTAKVFLWRQQGGQCPYCGQQITWATGWSIHHMINVNYFFLSTTIIFPVTPPMNICCLL